MGGGASVLDSASLLLLNVAMHAEHPFLQEGLEIAWSRLTPGQARVDIPLAVERARASLDALKALSPGEMTYENTFAALEEAASAVSRAWGLLMHLSMVMDGPELRGAVAELMPEVVSFSSGITLDPLLWKALQTASERPWMGALSPAQKRYVEEILADFREGGADLPEDKKARYAEVEAELSMAAKKFSENVLDSTNVWELLIDDPAELEGLPDSAVEAARQAALDKGFGGGEKPVWLFTQKATSSVPVMQYARSESLRRRMWEGGSAIGCGEWDNAGVISRILELRDEKARLLGFANYGDYAASRRMAGSGQRALDFIDDLHDKVYAAFLEEQESLRRCKEEKTGIPCPVMAPWETSYWAELRRRELYDFDAEALRPYYCIENVMKGLFAVFSRLYSIRFDEMPVTCGPVGGGLQVSPGVKEVWHPEVRCYEVHDIKTGEHLGSFYTDWHPRDSKRAGAWMNALQTGRPPVDGKPRVPHLALICGNLTRGTGAGPSLLSHREVETIFHEFGHLMHQILSDVEVRALAGTNVAWDFVELPSQINENWCWEREAVDLYARHYQTGEPIPAELFDKMLAARNYMSATDFMRQLSFGKSDLELHVHYDRYKGRRLEEVDDEILAKYRVPLAAKSPSVLRRFTHVFGEAAGYAAGYYSYKWAEVLEADAFSRFRREGVLNPATGADFRRCILSRGNSRPAAELYRDFMGRDPDPEALLVKTGISGPGMKGSACVDTGAPA